MINLFKPIHCKFFIMKHIAFILFCLIIGVSLSAQGPELRAAARIDQAVQEYNVSGEGVVIVMIDRGIDYRHPDFIDDQGNTRIAYIYDMVNPTGANDSNNPYGVGTIISRSQINASLNANGEPLSMDRDGRGTATTGIMAGNGSGTGDRRFKGVAPNATIISIKLTQESFPAFDGQPAQNSFFNPDYIPIALNFAQDKISELGLPSVTLLNVGTLGGPTDGTSAISRAIDDFVAQGNPFICGVGFEGGAANYARGELKQGETAEIIVEKGETGTLRFDLWYSEKDRFNLSIQRPNGTVEGPFPAPSGRGDAADNNLGDIVIYHRGADQAFFGATSDRREILIDNQGVLGTYKIILQASQVQDDGVFQATLNPSLANNKNRFGSFVVDGHSMNDYSSSKGAISPGDYVANDSWTNIDGDFYSRNGEEGQAGDLWKGSSVGPTQDGRLGIDFVAPGELGVGAYSPNTYYATFRSNIVQGSNGLYGIQGAVSASAALSTGIIALMLEINPDLNPDEILDLLHRSCISDSFTGQVPNNKWGYGKLDALLALQNTSLTVDAPEELSSKHPVKVYPNPFGDHLNIEIEGSVSAEWFGLYNSLGQLVWSKNSGIEQRYNLPLNNLPKGLYTLAIRMNTGNSLSARVVKK